MRDVDLLKNDPQALFDKFVTMLSDGELLSETQLLMLEALKNILKK